MQTKLALELNNRCSFSYPGTYGHECGKKPTKLFSFKSDITKSGIFKTGRCDECAKIKGGENAKILKSEDFQPFKNEWK